MKTNLLRTALAALCLAGLAVSTASAALQIDSVTVGNLGNPNDTVTASDGSGLHFGSVGYSYQIGKHEVSLTQYTAFLNAVAATDTNALYNEIMGTNLNIAGITRSGISGAYSYAVAGDGQRPVTYVSMLDAMRFANWVGNGQPIGVQDASTTEAGAYTMSLGGLAPRNAGATVFIPNENEWVKAAYYDPAKGGSNYWLYPTRSDSEPGNAIGAGANQANYYAGDYSVTQSGFYSPTQPYLTAGGAYSNSGSYYGTFDQGGNVWEWTEAIISVSNRGLRGGSWVNDSTALQSSVRHIAVNSSFEHDITGFRVASIEPIPEPGTALTGVLLLGVASARRQRRA